MDTYLNSGTSKIHINLPQQTCELLKSDINGFSCSEFTGYGNLVNRIVLTILLHYSKQGYDVRYQIYNQEIYDRILDGKKKKRSLRVSFYNEETVSIIPYGIESDIYHVHSYLVGLYESRRDLNNIALRNFSSIKSVSLGKHNVSLTKDECKYLKDNIAEKRVSYLRDQSLEFEVHLTPRGEKMYRDMAFQRPNHKPRTDEDRRERTYRFVGSPYQIKNYFRRFGADAVIISPQAVHDEMLEEYKKAFEAYSSF